MSRTASFKSCVTISLVPEARGGPFVFWDDLPLACQKASKLGFHAVEIFAPSADTIQTAELATLLSDLNLKLAAMGTGGGWVRHRLTLTSPDPAIRHRARAFIRSIIDTAANFGGSAIIGSMQGRWGEDADRQTALAWLAEALHELGEHASQYAVPLLLEPLNRYETNLVNRVADGVTLIDATGRPNVRLLCDLFHMNIEESDLAAALRDAGPRVGHIHFVDSNRRPAGCGHIDYAPIASALREIGYAGYLSAEALAYPDPDEAARLTITTYNRFFSHD